jgi:hypothetical protein
MEEMERMPQESNAIENCGFDAARLVILGAGVFTDLVSDSLGRDVILNVPGII